MMGLSEWIMKRQIKKMKKMEELMREEFKDF